MATKTFKLTHEDELRVTSVGLRRVFSFSLNGNRLGEQVSASQLTKGVSFGLSGGGRLTVSLDRGLFGGVDVMFNDRLVRGSASHGRTDWDRVVALLALLAVFNIAIGAASHFYHPDMLVNLGLGLNTLLFGAILGVLSFNIYRLRRWALITTMFLWASDSAVTVIEMSHRTGVPQVGALLVKIYIFYAFVRAFMADPAELQN